MSIPANISGMEYFNTLYRGTNPLLNMLALISFFGGRYVISDFYENRPDIICNPFVKILMLFAIIYMNIKNLKISILIFFVYVVFIDNFITEKCHKDSGEESVEEIERINEENLNEFEFGLENVNELENENIAELNNFFSY